MCAKDLLRMDNNVKVVLYICCVILSVIVMLAIIMESIGQERVTKRATTAALESGYFSKLNKSDCTFRKELIRIQEGTLQPPNSDTDLRLTGYLEVIEGHDVRYLPLQFETMEREQQYDNSTVIVLVGDCLSLEIKYVVTATAAATAITRGNSGNYQFKSIDVNMINERLKIARKFCSLPADTFGASFDEWTQYACKQARIRPCKRKISESRNQTVANLVLTSFFVKLRPESATSDVARKLTDPEDGCQLAQPPGSFLSLETN